MNPVQTLRYLVENKKSSLRQLAQEMGVAYSSLHAFEAGTAKSISNEMVNRLDWYLEQQTHTDNIEPYLPKNLRPEFEYVAMHGLSELNYQWAAFTIEPVFNPTTGFWSLPKFETEERPITGEQVNLGNLLSLPYDSAGPNRALYRRNESGFQKIPPIQTPVKHPIISEPPIDHQVNLKFPRTTQRGGGLQPVHKAGERNRV